MPNLHKEIVVFFSPEELGELFINLPADEQAAFFAAAWKQTRKWKEEGNPDYLLEVQLGAAVRESRGNLGAEAFLRILHEAISPEIL